MKNSKSFSSKEGSVNIINILSKDKLDKLKSSFIKKKPLHDGSPQNCISLETSFIILQENGFLINEEKKFEIFNFIKNPLKIDYNLFMKILLFLLNEKEGVSSEQINFDYIDAFVALGGNLDGSGFITVLLLKKALEEFQLCIDLKKVLIDIGVEGDNIDYFLFCKLFDTPIFDNQSMHSLFSCNLIYFDQKKKGFERNYCDFESFMKQHPNFFKNSI